MHYSTNTGEGNLIVSWKIFQTSPKIPAKVFNFVKFTKNLIQISLKIRQPHQNFPKILQFFQNLNTFFIKYFQILSKISPNLPEISRKC